MDREKVRAVEEWPKPKDQQALQRFLGFTNFYQRFIRSYSTIAAPLTHLTLVKVRFVWDEAAEEAFRKLKRRFVSAPILVHPDPKSQLIVKVDANLTPFASLALSLASCHTPGWLEASHIVENHRLTDRLPQKTQSPGTRSDVRSGHIGGENR